MRPVRRDVRLLGALLTAALVALGGAGIALLPGGAPPAAADTHAAEPDRAFHQGVALLQARQPEQALAAFHRVLRHEPRMPEAHANMGFALVALGRHREARDFFEGALDLRPSQLNAYYGLAVAAEALGDRETARGAMRTYAHLAPSSDPFRPRAEAALRAWRESGASP
jgi:Flp pilus assembly protein TadD